MHKGLIIFTLICMLCMFSFIPFAKSASDLSEVERQINEINEQLSIVESENARNLDFLDRLRELQSRTSQYLISIEESIGYSADQIEPLRIQLEEVSKEVSVLEEELDIAQKRVEERTELLGKRLRTMYMMDEYSYLSILLSSENFYDLITRYQYMQYILRMDKKLLEDNMSDKELIEKRKQDIDEKMNELEKMLILMERMNTVLQEEKIQKLNDMSDVQDQISELESITAEQERRLMELAVKQQELLEKKERLELAYNGEIMTYPLEEEYRITSHFGHRTDPVTGEKNAFHGGVDFGAPRGTKVVAASYGQVIVAGWNGGYGNSVVIDHGNDIWTVYGHMLENSLKVQVGDIVYAGDVIGQVGTTGKSTGYHLHFEVRKNQEAVDPLPYLGY